MKENKDFFWPSYVDLMTALFLTMLVLFVLSYKLFKDKEHDLTEERDKFQAAAEQLALIKRIERSLKTMMGDSTLFRYEKQFRRYTLARDVRYNVGQWNLRVPSQSLIQPRDTAFLADTGTKLKGIVDSLLSLKLRDPDYRDVSYVLAIVGNASNLGERSYNPARYTSAEDENYILSYQRAKSLYDFWREQRIVNFNDTTYHKVIELVIAGNGWGGVGRYKSVYPDYNEEKKNQRFLIQIVPKIGK